MDGSVLARYCAGLSSAKVASAFSFSRTMTHTCLIAVRGLVTAPAAGAAVADGVEVVAVVAEDAVLPMATRASASAPAVRIRPSRIQAPRARGARAGALPAWPCRRRSLP